MPRLLAFIPHPDDESYSFGGTLVLAAKAGWECRVECASYGERGKRHDGGPTRPDDVAEAREAELAESCDTLGAGPPQFWGLPDGEMRFHRGEHDRIRALIASLRPDLVLSLGADGAYGHPDHLALHRWLSEVWAALQDTKPPLLFPVFAKGLFLPQWEKCRHMMADPPVPAAGDIGADAWHYEVPIATVREQKLAAMGAHRSQLPGGDPEAMFPSGIVRALLEVERFEDASGAPQPDVAQQLAQLNESL